MLIITSRNLNNYKNESKFSFKFIGLIFSRSIILRLTQLVMLAGINHVACGECDNPPDARWVNVYEGTLGLNNIAISVALKFDQGNITGLYSYRNSTSDLNIKGKLLENGNKIELEVINEQGVTTEKFTGDFPKLNCKVITGKWLELATQRTYDFYLNSSHAMAGQLSNLYGYVGVTDAEIIHKAVTKLKSSIKIDDRNALASLIDYPISVNIDGERKRISNKSGLLKVYDQIFTSEYKKKILDAFSRNLFSRYNGVMLGSGEVWFDADGNIKALNN